SSDVCSSDLVPLAFYFSIQLIHPEALRGWGINRLSMTDFNDRREQERLQSYLKIHLKKSSLELSEEEQIKKLEKKDRNKWIMLAVNIAAVLVFSYSYYAGITKLGSTFLIIILAVFGINVGLIFYQKKQIKELIEYLTWKREG